MKGSAAIRNFFLRFTYSIAFFRFITQPLHLSAGVGALGARNEGRVRGGEREGRDTACPRCLVFVLREESPSTLLLCILVRTNSIIECMRLLRRERLTTCGTPEGVGEVSDKNTAVIMAVRSEVDGGDEQKEA